MKQNKAKFRKKYHVKLIVEIYSNHFFLLNEIFNNVNLKFWYWYILVRVVKRIYNFLFDTFGIYNVPEIGQAHVKNSSTCENSKQ